jgi:ribosomal protein S12 methylthiotransferase accessory factor
MIDVLATLHPDAGIARRYAVDRPQPPLDLLWRTIVDLTGDRPGIPPSARYVGACGHSRADALLRGAGEAVERAALDPARGVLPGIRRGRRADLGAATLDVAAPGVAMGAPGSGDRELTWYPARRLRDGAEILVPAALVDWPYPEPDARLFDPGPSGAASGAGYDMAVGNAVSEIIERDAIMVAWERGLRLPTIALPPDPSRTSSGVPADGSAAVPGVDRTMAAVGRLRAVAAAEGVRIVLAELPVAVPGVFCCVAIALDDTGAAATASVGCKASGDPGRSVLGALQEALQIRALLRHARTDDRYADPPERITGEHERVEHLLSRAGADLIREWAEGFAGARPLPTTVVAGAAGPATSTDTGVLVAGLVRDGCDPLAVDLTPRLPPVLRTMGWAAVKVIGAGYQTLRMDEEKSWTWHRARLVGAEFRTGLDARHGVRDCRRPHPLP